MHQRCHFDAAVRSAKVRTQQRTALHPLPFHLLYLPDDLRDGPVYLYSP